MSARARVVGKLALAAAMVGLAVVLILLARDAWHWGRAMQEADARASVGPVDPSAWRARTWLPSGLVRRLLGIDDDLAFRRAVEQAILVVRSGTSSRTVRGPVETALGRIADDDANRSRASRAADYLGVLLYTQPTPKVVSPYGGQGQPQAQTSEEQALSEFETAVDLDPENANAKRNLEAMLRQAQAPRRTGAGRAGTGEKITNKGSGSRPAGRGY